MTLIKVLARELMGLCRSLISHLMSTFHDNTNANGGYCLLNLHDDTWKCKGSQGVLMSVGKKQKRLNCASEIVECFSKKEND